MQLGAGVGFRLHAALLRWPSLDAVWLRPSDANPHEADTEALQRDGSW